MEGCNVRQLINGDGEFRADTLEDFMQTNNLNQCGKSYVVAAIMGPQSSGKSTLLNKLFGTNFAEMDACKGRNQTTKGIWMAKCADIVPPTIILDVEGTDGKERGEDDTTFEKHSTLFGLATSDILLINMWYNDIGRENGANKPLMKIVFGVMVKSFITDRKRTILFIIRDTLKSSPMEALVRQLNEYMDSVWESVAKPSEHKNKSLKDFFNVDVVALPHYVYEQDKFLEEIAELRQRFSDSTSPGKLAGDRREVIPASGFSFSTQNLWKSIRDNKNLDLPAHKVLVANFRCEEIANESLRGFTSDKDLLKLLKEIQEGKAQKAGIKLTTILEQYLSAYDRETSDFDVNARKTKRQPLKSKALEFVSPAFATMLGNLSAKSLENFKKMLDHSLAAGKEFEASAKSCSESCMLKFVEGCQDATIKDASWGAPNLKEKLQQEMDAHKSSLRLVMLTQLVKNCENKLRGEMGEALKIIFNACKMDAWASVRNLLDRSIDGTKSEFVSPAVVRYKLDNEEVSKMSRNLSDYARNLVEEQARLESERVSASMEKRFASIFTWTGKEDIKDLSKTAQLESLEILSIMAAIRLTDEQDNIKNLLISSLLDETSSPLTSQTWEEVSAEATLIPPAKCDTLWKQFQENIMPMIKQSENLAQWQLDKDDKIKELEQKIENRRRAVGPLDVLLGVASTILNPIKTAEALMRDN